MRVVPPSQARPGQQEPGQQESPSQLVTILAKYSMYDAASKPELPGTRKHTSWVVHELTLTDGILMVASFKMGLLGGTSSQALLVCRHEACGKTYQA